jgi:hypothetical protein
MKPFSIALVAACAIAVASTEALCDEGADEAKAAFEDGRVLFEKGEFEAAAAAFRRAYDANPAWKLFYNIGQCEAAAKHHGLAFEAFEAYLAQGGDDIPTDRRDEVVAEIKRLRPMVGSLKVTAPDGAEVIIDSEPRGTAPLPGKIKVAAGVNHRLEVVLGDEMLLDRELRISSGDVEVVEVKRVDEELAGEVTAGGEPEEPAEETDESSATKITGWVLIGVGSALAVGGSITGVGALKLDKDITGECSEDDGCLDVDRSDDVERRDALALTTDVLIGVGAAAFVTGILLLTVFDGDEEPDSADVAVVPVVGHDLAGAAMEWRF